MLYVIPQNPASQTSSLSRLRSRARRVGFFIERHRHCETWSLIDARLRLPLSGLDRVGLAEIAAAVETARNPQLLHGHG